jgi:hypothetical protein
MIDRSWAARTLSQSLEDDQCEKAVLVCSIEGTGIESKNVYPMFVGCHMSIKPVPVVHAQPSSTGPFTLFASDSAARPARAAYSMDPPSQLV